MSETLGRADGGRAIRIDDSEPGKAGPGTRKRNAERTKREILAVAGRRFARSGYTHVSLQDIAGEVGVTPAMINHHFGSKAALFAAIAHDDWGLNEQVHPLSMDAKEFAENLLMYWNDADARSPALALIRSLENPDAVELFRAEYERRVFAVWRPLLDGADVEERLKLMGGLMMGIGLFTTGVLLDPDEPPLDAADRETMVKYMERIIDVLING